MAWLGAVGREWGPPSTGLRPDGFRGVLHAPAVAQDRKSEWNTARPPRRVLLREANPCFGRAAGLREGELDPDPAGGARHTAR